jgi:aryl-alcohol dehydrogenase-like predicted oxidoreductase
VQKRPYGDTGVKLSILGFGGMVVANLEQSEADRLVAQAVARGVNYFDVAPSYHDAEERLGPALAPYRNDVFLACKTGERTAEGAGKELARSLQRLRTDHLDLYQLHGLSSLEEVEQAFAADGAMKVLEAAKRDGRARFLGFSAHSVEAALAALERYPFDSVLFPLNFVCWFGGFGPQVLEAAKARGAARLALKAVARTKWSGRERKHDKCWYEPYDDPELASLAFRWTLSHDITAAVSPGQHNLWPMMMDIADSFRPVTAAEEERLHELAMPLTPIFTAG